MANRYKIEKIGHIVMAAVDGEFTIKIVVKAKNGMLLLQLGNDLLNPTEIEENMQFEICGVVTGSFR